MRYGVAERPVLPEGVGMAGREKVCLCGGLLLSN